MPIKLNLAQLPEENIGFVYSVMRELLLGLNVLNNPKKHPLHISWALSTRKKLPTPIRTEAKALSPVIATASRFLVTPEEVEEANFEIKMNKLNSIPVEMFAEVLINDFLIDAPPNGKRPLKKLVTFNQFKGSQTHLETAARNLNRWYGLDDSLIKSISNTPHQIQIRFSQFIQNYWESFFHQEWSKIESIIIEEITSRGQELMDLGIMQMLDNLSDRFSIDYTLQSARYFKNDIEEECTFRHFDTLNLYPSYYTYPSFNFFKKQDSHADPFSLSITYPLPHQRQAGQPPAPSKDLLNILRGVADSTRLQILTLVAHKPCSTAELSRVIGLSESAISKQLKLMHQVGWVTAKRDSYYVLYRASAHPLEEITNGLNDLLFSK
ncbi:MAG: metalloregulator ArsR/SmtB family transcription factor [Chloroflexota bacterium]